MRNIFIFLGILMHIVPVRANPACMVCTVAIGSTLTIARKLGVDDSVVAIWLGGLLALLGYWSIVWFDKKQWHFAGRNYLLMLLSFSMIAGVYWTELTYTPQIIGNILYLDPFLFATAFGMLIYIFSQKFYQFLKRRNGGRAHFPFEKVVLPICLLGIASVYVSYFPLCQ